MQTESPYPRPNLAPPSGPVCPDCRAPAGKRVSFTWWGGALGPGLMNLHKCQACGTQFNAKTGLPAKRAIIIYTVIVNAICLIVVIAFALARG